MIHWDDSHLEDDRKKWSEWTMRPKKQPRKPARYASAFVFTMSAIVMSGLHQQLFI